MVLAGGAPGIDIDRNERLGLVEHDVAAGSQLHDRREHGVKLVLDAVARQQRLGVGIELHVLGMARHQHAHEFLGLVIALAAGNHDLIDVLAVEVAKRAFDQRTFLVNELRRGRFER